MIEIQSRAAALIDAAVGTQLKQALRGPLVVGLCGSQGSGKTTISEQLVNVWTAAKWRVASLSLDGLYLSRESRMLLSQHVHPLLITRGVPGTHDTALGLQTLRALAQQARVMLPRFDKTRDDRRPVQAWDLEAISHRLRIDVSNHPEKALQRRLKVTHQCAFCLIRIPPAACLQNFHVFP